MAVFTVKSTAISNRDATPKVLTDALVAGGEVLECEGFVATGSATDGVGSKYLLCSVPSNARLSSLKLQNQALGAGGKVNVGLYYPSFIPVGAGLLASQANSAISASLFAAALDVSAAAGPAELIGNVAIDLQELPLWAMAGMAADPMIDLDIVAAVSTVLAAAGKIGAKALYVKQ